MAKSQDTDGEEDDKNTRGFTQIEKCVDPIDEYGEHLRANTEDNNVDKRDGSSTVRYLQDIRWYNDWCLENGYDPLEVRKPHAGKVGRALDDQYSGTTGLYRWDRITAMYEWFWQMEYVESNPFKKWDARKNFTLTKTTNRGAEGKDQYFCTEDDIRAMEQNVTRHRVRDQLLIRMLWQTGMRRGEASRLEPEMIDRKEREITLPGDITKNDKERVVAYQQSLDHLLSEWLDSGKRDEMLGIVDDDEESEPPHNYVFSGERAGQLRGERINEIVRDAAIEAGINERVHRDANASEDDEENNRWLVTAHSVRHGYGNYLIHETDAGLWEISRQMGHHSVTVTEKLYEADDPRAGIEHSHKYGPE